MLRPPSRRTGRRLVGVSLLAGLSLLTGNWAGAANAAASPMAAATIKADSDQFPVFGVQLTQAADVDKLTNVVVRFNSTLGFSTGDLAPNFSALGCSSGNATSCDGIQMFRDNGTVDDALDASDTAVSLGYSFLSTNCAVGCDADIELTDETTGVAIPLSSANEGLTFLIAIRSSDSISHNDQFTVTLQPNAFTTVPTPTLMPSIVTTDPITADTAAPDVPVVTGLGLSRAAGRVHVTTPAASSESPGSLQVYSSSSDSCSSPTFVADSGSVDLTRTRDDLLGASAAAALRAFPAGQYVCYRVVDAAGNASAFASDGVLPATPSAANVALLSAANITGSKQMTAAADTAARTLRMYIRPGNTGDYVRARNEDAVVHDEWIEVTTSTSGSVCSVNSPGSTCTTDIRRYENATSAGATLAAGDGVGYTLVNANGNEGDATADGVVPATPVAADLTTLKVSAATDKQRLIASGGTSGATFGLYMDTSGLGTTYRVAVTPAGTPVTVTTTGGTTDSGTTEIRSQTGGGTQLAAGHAIAYAAIDAGGNLSALAADGVIPAAPASADLTFSDALNRFHWNPAVVPANTNVRLFTGGSAGAAYGDGTGLGTATGSTPVSVSEQDAGRGIFYTALSTTTGHESPTTSDGSVPAAPDAGDVSILAASAATGHQRTISSPDVGAPRTFRLYLDPAGGTAWTRASTMSGGTTPIEVTTSGGTATSGGTPGAQSIFAGTTQLAGAHAVGFALTSSGNDSDVVADGAIPAAPSAAHGSVNDAVNSFTFTSASTAYRVNLHLGGTADTAALAYNPAGPHATTNSASAVTVTEPANESTVFYTATEPATGHESATTADGSLPAAPLDATGLSVSAVADHQRLRADADASGPRTYRLFVDPAGASAWQLASAASGGSTPIDLTTSTSAATASATTAIFAGSQQLDAGWAIGYGHSNGNGHGSEVLADATIPAAPNLSTAAASAAVDEVTMTGIATNHTVRVYADANASRSAAYTFGPRASLTSADGEAPLDTAGGWGVWYTSTTNVAGHESPIVTEGTIPVPIDASVTQASDVTNQFVVPGASAADNVLIIMSTQAGAVDAYNDESASRWTATTSPFSPGAELNSWFVYYTVKNAASGNESPITSADSIPAAPSTAPAAMSASAAMQRIASSLDSAARTLRLYVDVDGAGAGPMARASTTAGGTSPVQIVTSTTAEVVGAAGIFAGSAPLAAGHDVAYARVAGAFGQNESDLVTDGSVPFAPLADAFTASAADQQATIGSSAVSGTYRVFRGSSPASDKRTHTSGTATTVSTSGLVAGDVMGYALSNGNGNESPLLADGSIPSVSAPDLRAASDSGFSSNDQITNATSPVFDIATVAAASVTLLEGGTVRGGPVTADGAGLAPITAASLPEGTRALTALATKDGNTSPLSGALSVTVDLTAPSAPSQAPDLDASSDTGDSATDDLTSDATPLINVAGAPNGSVTVREGATVVGIALTNGTGSGQATVSTLAEGARTLTATTSDAAGNESPASPSLAITLDLTAPDALAAPDLASASDSGSSSTDDVTNDATPTVDVAGVAANVTVKLRSSGSEVGSAASGAGGTVSVTASSLADGARSLTALAVDAAGNVGDASPVLVVSVDSVAPVVPSVPDVVAASDSGSSSSDDVTSDSTPSVSLAGNEVGASVVLVEGESSLGSAVAGSDGVASVTSSVLSDGVHVLAGKAFDLAGNASAVSDGVSVTVDTVAPAGLVGAPDLLASSDSGSSSSDDVTNVVSPSVSVSGAEPGSSVSIVDAGASVGSSSVDGEGDATVTVSSLSDGVHELSAVLTDVAGNAGAASPALSLTVDTVAPDAPSAPDLLVASDSGSSSTDNVTNDTTPEVRVGGTEAGVTAELLEAAAALASGTTTIDGVIDLIPSASLGDGAHVFTARATDAAGNISTTSAALTVTVDTAAPAAPAVPDLVAASDTGSSSSDDITKDATPEIALSGETGATLAVFAGATSAGERVGEGSVTVSALTEGVHTLTAKATDVAGNAGASSAGLAVTIDTTAPTVTLQPPSTLLGVAKAVFSEDVGSVAGTDLFVRLDAARPAPTRGAAPQTAAVIYDAAAKRASLTLNKALLPGEHYELVMAASPDDVAGNVVAPAVQAFRASLVEQEVNSAGTHGWRIVGTPSSAAFGGSYATERAAGARLSMVFSGTQVTWYTVIGPGQGIAHVYIDGTYMGLFNNYAPRTTYKVGRVFSGLSSGTLHNILIVVGGAKGSQAATDTQVAVDAFEITYPSGNRVTLASPPVTYLWRILATAAAKDGKFVQSDQPGAAVSFAFRGTKFAWYPVLGPSHGRARVFIDGVDKGVVDLYSASTRYGQLRFFGGLADGVHTVRIVALGTRSAASRGTIVATDQYAIG